MKHNLRNTVLGVFLALAMMITVMPAKAYAEDEPIAITGGSITISQSILSQLVPGGTVPTVSEGDFTVSDSDQYKVNLDTFRVVTNVPYSLIEIGETIPSTAEKIGIVVNIEGKSNYRFYSSSANDFTLNGVNLTSISNDGMEAMNGFSMFSGGPYLTMSIYYVVYPASSAPADEDVVSTDYLDDLRDMLDSVKEGTVYWNKGDALPLDVMEKIKKSNVTLEFSYTYEGNDITVRINKDNVPTEEVPWYGPAYLVGKIGNSNVAANRVYTVVAGDTLSKIANKLTTTVEALLQKNSSIKNRNLIFVGQKINY